MLHCKHHRRYTFPRQIMMLSMELKRNSAKIWGYTQQKIEVLMADNLETWAESQEWVGDEEKTARKVSQVTRKERAEYI